MNDIREDMKLKVKVAYAHLKALIELSLSSAEEEQSLLYQLAYKYG